MTDTKRYRTKTFFRRRSNGSVKGVWLCALDIGYSSVKVFTQNIAAVFPSFAKRFSGETVGTLPGYYLIYRDVDTGEKWLVGEAALNDMSQGDVTLSEEALFGQARYDDPMFLVLARTGLGIGAMENDHGAPGGKPVHLQTGLPPKYMKTDKPKLVDALAGRHRFALRLGDSPEQVFDIELRRENIYVMEQPKGTLMSVAMDNSHRFVGSAKEYFNKNVLIFDAGFGTLDIFPIKNNRVESRQTFPEYSMKQVFSETIDAIYDRYGVVVSLIGIQKCLGDGYIRCHGKFSSRSQEFGELLENASADVCGRAMERLGQIYDLYEYEYLIITGGTGAAWNGQIREKLRGLESLTIINGNQNDTTLPFLFANVRGYYMYLYEKMGRAMAGRS